MILALILYLYRDMRLTRFLLYISLIFSLKAHAFLESPEVLPKGINSVSLITGQMGINHYYSGQGLVSVSDHESIEFDLETLKGIDSEVSDLYNALSQFGPKYNFGEAIHMGALKLDLNPSINYQSLVYAYGISEKWSIGVGLTFISFNLNVGMKHVGSNIPELKKQLGGLDENLDNAFDALNRDATLLVQQELNDRGYAPLESKSKHFFGDTQLVNLYNFLNDEMFSVTSSTKFFLPTGPHDDPNDLTDLEGFHTSSFDQKVIAEYKAIPSYSLVGSIGYRWNLPDQISKRVPNDEADSLPKAEQLQQVSFQTGDQITLHLAGVKKFDDNFSLGLGYNYLQKSKDKYITANLNDASILERNTNSKAESIDVELSYSTVKDYFNKKAIIPFNVWLSVSDVFKGLNTQRRTDFALWAMVFF